MKRFALIGVGGHIAPKHLKAIQETDNILVAALDKHDAVRILDDYFPQADFFVEFERFERHIELLRRKGEGIDYVSICSPNYLHDSHVRFALRSGVDAICEKPLVLNPWNVTALACAEKETGRKIHNILQLRLHPAMTALKTRIDLAPPAQMFDVDLTYITSRGRWYFTSWKGDTSKSGGIVCNIGIHFFDLLLWMFGDVKNHQVHLHDAHRAAGFLELKRARVRWFLSIDPNDLVTLSLPPETKNYRSLTIDGEAIEFSSEFLDLHTQSYRQILAGQSFTTQDVYPSIALTADIRNATPLGRCGVYHPMLTRMLTLAPQSLMAQDA